MLNTFTKFPYKLTAIGHFEAAIPMHHVFWEFSNVGTSIVVQLKLALAVFQSELKLTLINISLNSDQFPAAMWQPINKCTFVKRACWFVNHLAHFPETILKMTRKLITIIELEHSAVF